MAKYFQTPDLDKHYNSNRAISFACPKEGFRDIRLRIFAVEYYQFIGLLGRALAAIILILYAVAILCCAEKTVDTRFLCYKISLNS